METVMLWSFFLTAAVGGLVGFLVTVSYNRKLPPGKRPVNVLWMVFVSAWMAMAVLAAIYYFAD